ncbi:MAG: hypothetical protein CMA41_07135 [Euryarchaeota archaeon]|jgi:hypothetical protein|nr:hypothetical protein [Euryarchaeota archaeon]MBF14887.1 hypothetical protein [Euryarchaeota archaeon]|tara:strand:+ start:2641 stop:4674 length:2034 start_codon:yes stop_codon:yes gene_type:complete
MDAILLRVMRTQAFCIVLLLLFVIPVQPVSADENDTTLEAREAQAEFLPDMETTLLQWRNIHTTDGLLLDQLKMATYEVHRLENGRFFSNAITPETLIAEDIPACYINELNEVCSGKVHSILYEPIPGTEASVSYAIITTLRDGTRTETVGMGFSQTPEGHMEIVAAYITPEQFSVSYDVANESTVFTWRPACPGNNFYHTLYEHNVPATKSTWNEMDKTVVTNFIPASASQFTLDWTNQSVEREVYYTLTCWYPAYCDEVDCYPAREDTRIHSGNSLAVPVTEDNQAPRYAGILSAQFNVDEVQTVLQWSEITQQDISTIRIYHAANPILSAEQNGVQILAELDATSVEFIHHLPVDWMLTSYYAIGLVDIEGNIQLDQFDVSGKVGPIIERNLPVSISSLQISQENTTIHLQWDLNPYFISGDAVLWISSSSNPDLSPAWQEITRLNPATLEHHMTIDVAEESWYALTLEGTWGSSPSTHHDNRIYLDKNAVLFTPKIQETDPGLPSEEIVEKPIDLPEFEIILQDENYSLSNGDWITLESETNQSYTLRFTHSQSNSTIRWTDALNSNPFWAAGIKTDDGFSIVIAEPINLIHIESTDANGKISIVRVGIDWPDIVAVEPENTTEQEVVEDKAGTEDESVSMPLLIVVGIIAVYTMIIFSMKKKDELLYSLEEE